MTIFKKKSGLQSGSKRPSNIRVLLFMVVLSFVCALILSLLASALQKPQEIAKELDRSKQMLIAARIIGPEGTFEVKNDEGEYVPAEVEGDGTLTAGEPPTVAAGEEILAVYRKRIRSFLVNDKGEISTFEEAGIDEQKYLADYRKSGYYREPWKLIYEILPADGSEGTVGYVIPVNGSGLWDAIYGYLAVEPDGDTVIGISWYDQKETPGLGANITDFAWQREFFGKKIFQESADGKTDFSSAPLGITVVKGKVADVYGTTPKSKSAVDGMAGATLTGNGVTNAYREVFAAYRPFLLKTQKKSGGETP